MNDIQMSIQLNQRLCDPRLVGQRIRAKQCSDRRYIYRGVIEGAADAGFAIDDTPCPLYRMRCENKWTWTGYVDVYQEDDGEWLVLFLPSGFDDE